MGQHVAILGASSKPDRFAYKAFEMLKEFGHTPHPVTPKFNELEGVQAVANLRDLTIPIDTLTMYVGPDISTKLKSEILNLHPKRVIFNPGSENLALEEELENAGIEVVEGCTLVMLQTRQF
jgi:predicted CoA-binding protein